MIPAPGIEDQELSIAAEGSGVNNPAVTRRCDLSTGPACQRNAFFDATGTVGTAKITDFAAVDRQFEQPFGRGKGDCRAGAIRVLQRGQIGLAAGGRRISLQGGTDGGLGRAFHVQLHLGDQALQVVDLAGKLNRARALGLHVLLDPRLLALPFVDQDGKSVLIVLELIAVCGKAVALANRDQLKDNQTRLSALINERQRQQAGVEKDMEAEGARAVALARQVDDLQGLITKMELDVKSAAKAAASATLQGNPAATGGKPDLAALKNPNRTSPAVAFASAKGLFKLPVNGSKIRDFGSSDGAGGIEKGISLATRPGAQVTTPCDGWVVYAGPFRSYGQLLILNAGGGYHVLIAGMERISVNIGQFVLTGEPVATMGTTSQVASIFATNASQPVLYVEFRKDGTPIDPGPWWATNEGEKVRG